MIERAFTDRDRRAIVIGGVVLLIAAITLRGIPALVRWTMSERARAERLSAAVSSARLSSDSLVSLSDSARARARRAALLDSLFLQGGSATLSAASLAGELSNDAAQAGLHLAAVQAEPEADSAASVRRIRAHASLSGQLAAVMRFLIRVENGPPLLSVDELSLSQPGAMSNGQPETIRADVVIEGMAKEPAPRGAQVQQ